MLDVREPQHQMVDDAPYRLCNQFSRRPTFVRPARPRALALHFAALGAVTLDQHLSAGPVRCGRELLQAGLNATCMPAFVPWPPAGLYACAASPQRKARPQQKRETLRPLLRKQASQIGSDARTRRRGPVDHGLTYSRVRAGGWISLKAAGRQAAGSAPARSEGHKGTVRRCS